ncbi:MAG: transcriptional regulator [Rhizobiales bacterium PAR1]|nr:MAG: transcriptional regulator [Rhizobiales bacterium PAR1]
MHISLIDAPAAALGESPLWDPERRCLFWVDTVGRRIWCYTPHTRDLHSWATPAPVGSIGLADMGQLVVALAGGFSLFTLASEAWKPLWTAPHDPLVRLNDGKMDRTGRYLCGGMGIKADPIGNVYRLSPNGAVSTLKRGLRISNTICFSPDGGTLYVADSLSHCIMQHSYGADDGPIGPERLFCDTTDLGSGPDGATVDAEGFLWVALVRAGKIARLAPDGTLDRLIEVPVDLPSCPAFGGDDLSTLYVTSIQDSGTGRAVSTLPEGGRVVVIEGLGVRGLAETRMRPAGQDVT